MGKIKIQHFGPIKTGCTSDDGTIDIRKVLLFVGNQGSGKSTAAKLISTLAWIEKALVRGDYKKSWFEANFTELLSYHRLERYVRPDTFVEYAGEACRMEIHHRSLRIEEIENPRYILPQIMYVPAERNFLTYVKSPKELRMSSASLSDFLTEYEKALRSMKGNLRLPVNEVELENDKKNRRINIKGDDFKVDITEASSGFQSLVPLYLVSSFLAKSVGNNRHSDSMNEREKEEFRERLKQLLDEFPPKDSQLNSEQRRILISSLASQFNKQAFINIVEEPEQNLYPDSQWKILRSLLEFNNLCEGNRLLMTTHSPYIIAFLTHFVKAWQIGMKAGCPEKVGEELDNLVSRKAWLAPEDLKIYQFRENDGSIVEVPAYMGLPSDENPLNEALAGSNDLFTKLLEIEDLCR